MSLFKNKKIIAPPGVILRARWGASAMAALKSEGLPWFYRYKLISSGNT
jgi:hypothetical protein